MKRFTISATSVALDADGLAAGVTLATEATLSATTIGDGLAHEITITGLAATNHSGKTITVTGTDADGNALSTTIAGPNGAVAVTTTGVFFKDDIAVSISATAGADTFNIGWNANAVTASYFLDQNADGGVFNVGFGCDRASGTYTVQHSYGGTAVNTWFDHASVSGETSDQEGSYTTPIAAMRLKMTAAGTVVLNGVRLTG